MRIRPAVALGAALLAGCGALPSRKPWSPADPAGRAGAVLIALNAQTRMSDFSSSYVTLFWPPDGLDPRADSTLLHAPRVDVPLARANAFPFDALLVPMDPGTYRETDAWLVFVGLQGHENRLLPDKVASFTVEPGKVTVLGRLELTAAAIVTSQTADSRRFQLQTGLHLDDSPAAKAAVLAAALARPEAASLGWRAALESARAALK